MDLVATTKGAVPRHDPAKTAVPTSARHLASDMTMMRLMQGRGGDIEQADTLNPPDL